MLERNAVSPPRFVTVWKSGKNSGGYDYCSWGYTFLSRNKCRGVASETHPRWRPRWCVRSKRQHQSMRRLRILCLWQASLRAAMLETQLTRSSSSCLLVVGIQLSAATCCSGVYTLRLLSKWVWTEQYTRSEPWQAYRMGRIFFLMNRSTPNMLIYLLLT